MTQRPGERAQRRLGKDVADQTVVLDDRDLLVLEGGHAGRFLTAVLQGVERVVTEMGHGAPGRHDADNAAGFFHDLLDYGS